MVIREVFEALISLGMLLSKSHLEPKLQSLADWEEPKRTQVIKALPGNQNARQVDLPIRGSGFLTHHRNQDCCYFADDL